MLGDDPDEDIGGNGTVILMALWRSGSTWNTTVCHTVDGYKYNSNYGHRPSKALRLDVLAVR